jgi:hypothetical protein
VIVEQLSDSFFFVEILGTAADGTGLLNLIGVMSTTRQGYFYYGGVITGGLTGTGSTANAYVCNRITVVCGLVSQLL